MIRAICRGEKKQSTLEKGNTGEREVHLICSTFPAQGMSLSVTRGDPGGISRAKAHPTGGIQLRFVIIPRWISPKALLPNSSAAQGSGLLPMAHHSLHPLPHPHIPREFHAGITGPGQTLSSPPQPATAPEILFPSHLSFQSRDSAVELHEESSLQINTTFPQPLTLLFFHNSTEHFWKMSPQ